MTGWCWHPRPIADSANHNRPRGATTNFDYCRFARVRARILAGGKAGDQPRYAGYVAWRDNIDIDRLSGRFWPERLFAVQLALVSEHHAGRCYPTGFAFILKPCDSRI